MQIAPQKGLVRGAAANRRCSEAGIFAMKSLCSACAGIFVILSATAIWRKKWPSAAGSLIIQRSPAESCGMHPC
jgi:hypothetical protein